MQKWFKRLRGVVGMGLAWAVSWAAFGLLIGVASKVLTFLPWHYFFDVWDAPLPALGLPGFFGGALFAVVLGVAAGRAQFNELTVPKVAAWGALGGLLVSLIPIAMTAVGLAHLREGLSAWTLWAVIAVPLVLLSTASAAASLLVARGSSGRTELLIAAKRVDWIETRSAPRGKVRRE